MHAPHSIGNNEGAQVAAGLGGSLLHATIGCLELLIVPPGETTKEPRPRQLGQYQKQYRC